MPVSLKLDTGSAAGLVAPHVSAGRKDEIERALQAIAADFSSEKAEGLAALERNLRAWTTLHERRELAQRTLEVAERVRAGFDTFVHVGIGGSDLGPRVAHEVLDHTLHNELAQRGGAPRVYFAGDTFDPRPLRQLLDLLAARGDLPRTAFNIVSKSGKTPETLCALMAIKDRLGDDWMRQVVLTTGERPGESILFDLAAGRRSDFIGILPVPEGVGGRFSEPSPVGLLPLAVAADQRVEGPEDRVQAALEGHGAAHRRGMLPPDDPQNIAFCLARWLQYAEEQLGVGSLVLYDYSGCRMLGDWLVQLYTESIQERGAGLNVIASRGPTSNHSLLNGIISGPRDKIILFLRWADLGEDLDVPTDTRVGGGMEIFMGRKMAQLQEASLQGTVQDMTRNGVPVMVLTVGARDTAHLFAVMRVLMDMVAVKGRLQGLHVGADGAVVPGRELTYLQAGVEGYKQAMRDYLTGA
jgi:glucose-6-phosphate isomerase